MRVDGLPLAQQLLTAAADVTNTTLTTKPWGYELAFMLGDCLTKVITVNEGFRTSLQMHEHKEETIVILSHGKGGGVYGGEQGNVLLCDTGSIRIVPGTIHRTVGPVVLFEVQTNFPDDVIRIADDYGR